VFDDGTYYVGINDDFKDDINEYDYMICKRSLEAIAPKQSRFRLFFCAVVFEKIEHTIAFLILDLVD
jgi:hypothetical protein